MQTRTKELRAQLTLIASHVTDWQPKVEMLRAEADAAMNGRMIDEGRIEAATRMAAAIAEEMDRFYYLARAFSDLPGVRDGQFNGIGIALERLSETCGRIIVTMESVQDSVAA